VRAVRARVHDDAERAALVVHLDRVRAAVLLAEHAVLPLHSIVSERRKVGQRALLLALPLLLRLAGAGRSGVTAAARAGAGGGAVGRRSSSSSSSSSSSPVASARAVAAAAVAAAAAAVAGDEHV
jgi:hypothetical protein